MNKDYLKIINLPHHQSKLHKKMSVTNRAAQFMPFSALTGYDEAILETARLTLKEKEISIDKSDLLNHKLIILSKNKNPYVTITYFENDKRKSGGEYLIKEGIIKKIDIDNHKIIFIDQFKVDINKIYNIESELFFAFD